MLLESKLFARIIHDQYIEQKIAASQEQEVQSDAPAARAPEAGILGDLLSPLAIEGPPGVSEIEGLSEDVALFLAPVGEHENGVKIGIKQSDELIKDTSSSSWGRKVQLHLTMFNYIYRLIKRTTDEKPGWCSDPHLPSAAFVKIMAHMFSQDAWRCLWYMIQNQSRQQPGRTSMNPCKQWSRSR